MRNLKSKLALIVVLCALSTSFGSATYMVGDDDGFNTGTPVVPGDYIMMGGFGIPDGDGTDQLVPNTYFIHNLNFNFEQYDSINSASIFVQFLNWPKYGTGYLYIDYIKTNYYTHWVQFPETGITRLVRGLTFDITPWSDQLLDGSVLINLRGCYNDSYVLDYATLTIDGIPTQAAIPVPGTLLLAGIGSGVVGLIRRKRIL